ATDLVVQADGAIVIVGPFEDDAGRGGLTLVRLKPNGTLNTSFGTLGLVRVAVKSQANPAAQAALLPDGKLVVVGGAPGDGTGNDFFTARFTLADTLTTENQRYVNLLYLQLLGRAADAGGLNAFVGLLEQATLTRGQVALAIANSDEYRNIVVRNLYRTLLGREAEQAGLDFFVSFLRAGGTVPQLKAVLIGSAEYFQKNGGTNDGFVTALYRDVLGRAADPGGRQFFNQVLAAGVPRTDVAGLIVVSRENLERIVQGWFRQYLRRSADPGGLNGF